MSVNQVYNHSVMSNLLIKGLRIHHNDITIFQITTKQTILEVYKTLHCIFF